MAADTLPVMGGVLRDQRRSLTLWSIALAAVSAMYIAFWPSIGGDAMSDMIETMPEDLVVALGYQRIGTAAGYITSTVYGLLGPVLLLVFAVSTGARLVAGEEEDGSLELELTSPVARQRVFVERLATLWLDVLLLVVALTVAGYALVVALDIELGLTFMLAGSTGLYLLAIGFGTLALAVGAITGRRAVALGVGAALAVLAFMFNAIGPVVDAGWMTAVSPFSWFLENEPLTNGFDVPRLLLLAAVPVVSAVAGLVVFTRRDLMV